MLNDLQGHIWVSRTVDCPASDSGFVSCENSYMCSHTRMQAATHGHTPTIQGHTGRSHASKAINGAGNSCCSASLGDAHMFTVHVYTATQRYTAACFLKGWLCHRCVTRGTLGKHLHRIVSVCHSSCCKPSLKRGTTFLQMDTATLQQTVTQHWSVKPYTLNKQCIN